MITKLQITKLVWINRNNKNKTLIFKKTLNLTLNILINNTSIQFRKSQYVSLLTSILKYNIIFYLYIYKKFINNYNLYLNFIILYYSKQIINKNKIKRDHTYVNNFKKILKLI